MFLISKQSSRPDSWKEINTQYRGRKTDKLFRCSNKREPVKNKSLYALDFIEYTVTRMPAKSAGKTRLSDSGLVRQAAIPVRVGISNGRRRHESSAHQSTFRHRPIRLPRRPAVGHFALVTYHNRLLQQTRIFPLLRPPLSTTTFDHDSRLLAPTRLAATRIARRRGPFRVPLVWKRGPKGNGVGTRVPPTKNFESFFLSLRFPRINRPET